MNCRKAKKRVMAQLDARLPADQEAELRTHLGSCKRCRQQAAESTLAMQWVHDLPEALPSENFDWRLRLRLSQLESGIESGALKALPESKKQSWTLQFAASAAAAAVVVLALGFMVFRAPEGPSIEGTPVAVEDTESQNLAGQGRLPNLAPRERWLHIVPTSAGAPLGPDPQQAPAPSILGEAPPESVRVVH